MVTDERLEPADLYDARVEEVELVVTMAERLYEGLDPGERGAQRRLHVLLTECRQRVSDLRQQQHREATAHLPSPGSAHFGRGNRRWGGGSGPSEGPAAQCHSLQSGLFQLERHVGPQRLRPFSTSARAVIT